jgi:photosystem II stability/assembly factor-like uncharacterized protein
MPSSFYVTLSIINQPFTLMKKLLLFLLITPFGLTAQNFWTEVAPFGNLSNYYPDQISIVDDEVVWAKGIPNSSPAYNQFSISLDAGLTWTNGEINLGNIDFGIATLHAVSATRAYVAAFPTQPGSTGGIWKTDDAGATWTQQTTAFNSGTSFANLIHFFDLNNGVAVGDPQNGDFEVYTTTNGGVNWTAIAPTDIPDPYTNEYGYTKIFEARGNNIWFGTNRGRIYHSNDMGLHWTVSQSPLPDFGGSPFSGHFAFKNATDGIMVGSDWQQWKTTDGGVTWTFLPSTIGHVRNSQIVCVPQTNNAYFSWGADIDMELNGSSYTTDGADVWHDLSVEDQNPVYPFEAAFQTGAIGFCIGVYENPNDGNETRFFRLTDPLNRLLKKQAFVAEKPFLAAPNPTKDVVKLSGNSITSVDVYDICGKLLISKTYNGLKEVTLDFSQLQAGAYFAKANGNENSSTVKIIKN